MRFIDEASISVTAGNGGRGCVSFRREKYVPRGGPDGGNGGRGGDVLLVADEALGSLIDFRYLRYYRAQSGAHGRGKKQNGRSGKNLVIPVPVGTLVRDRETGELLGDLITHGEKLVVARGGRGGKGNASFVTSTRQAPRYSQDGEEGTKRWIRLELKLLADVGVIGPPNSGKSTLVSILSAARPKIADYPFTTRRPSLGVVRYAADATFVIADIPGLIAGAHAGSGMGTAFLRHIERTQILVHLLDGSQEHSDATLRDFTVINTELVLHNPALADRPQVVAINKMDLPEARANFPRIKDDFHDRGITVFPVSAATGRGIEPLISRVTLLLSRVKMYQEVRGSKS